MTLVGKTVLVTGGTGFLGNRLVEKLILEHQARVRVLVRNFAHASRIARFPLEMLYGDITDATAVRQAAQGCDVVFHCAFDFAGTRETQKQVSVQGSHNVCEAVLEARARLVHVSTFAVYAPMSDGDLTESSPWPRSTDAYSEIKRETERLVLGLHKQRGLPVVVIQPTLIYGPFSPHWTLSPVDSLKTGLVPLLNEGAGYCNAVYVDDVVDALILAATQPEVLGETFLISGEEPVTWREFYGAFEKILGVHTTIDLSQQELTEALEERRSQSSTTSRLLKLVRHPEVFPQFVSLPFVQMPLKIVRNCLSDNAWEALKSRMSPNGSSSGKENGKASKPVHLPGKALLALYQSYTRVRIDKARTYLTYQPRFDLTQGMALTAQFLRWANLV